MTRIYLVRHGESQGNAARMYLGHTDLDLTELGYKQARETAEHLKNLKISAIYSSDLQRAMHTAEPHAAPRGLNVVPSFELREMNVGEWEGVHLDVLLQDERFIKGWRDDFGNFTLPGGECVAKAGDRIYRELEKIAKAHDGEVVMAVFHAGAMRAFWCKILGIPKDDWASAVPFPTNASYSVVEYENGVFTPIVYSEDSHLEFVTHQP